MGWGLGLGRLRTIGECNDGWMMLGRGVGSTGVAGLWNAMQTKKLGLNGFFRFINTGKDGKSFPGKNALRKKELDSLIQEKLGNTDIRAKARYLKKHNRKLDFRENKSKEYKFDEMMKNRYGILSDSDKNKRKKKVLTDDQYQQLYKRSSLMLSQLMEAEKKSSELKNSLKKNKNDKDNKEINLSILKGNIDPNHNAPKMKFTGDKYMLIQAKNANGWDKIEILRTVCYYKRGSAAIEILEMILESGMIDRLEVSDFENIIIALKKKPLKNIDSIKKCYDLFIRLERKPTISMLEDIIYCAKNANDLPFALSMFAEVDERFPNLTYPSSLIKNVLSLFAQKNTATALNQGDIFLKGLLMDSLRIPPGNEWYHEAYTIYDKLGRYEDALQYKTEKNNDIE